MIELLQQFVEKANRPGVLGIAGRRVELQCEKMLKQYFQALGAEIERSALFSRVATFHNPTEATHFASVYLAHPIKVLTPLLRAALETHIAEAMLVADKISALAEAAKPKSNIDHLGLTGQEAAEYAASQAAKQVSGINETTVKLIADAVGEGIEKQLGMDGTGRLIRSVVKDMSVNRAKRIASYEINDAMSEATLRKLEREQVSYKQIITVDNPCPICASIEDAGPVPVDQPFVDEDGESYDRTPIHVGCRCATTGARAPE